MVRSEPVLTKRPWRKCCNRGAIDGTFAGLLMAHGTSPPTSAVHASQSSSCVPQAEADMTEFRLAGRPGPRAQLVRGGFPGQRITWSLHPPSHAILCDASSRTVRIKSTAPILTWLRQCRRDTKKTRANAEHDCLCFICEPSTDSACRFAALKA